LNVHPEGDSPPCRRPQGTNVQTHYRKSRENCATSALKTKIILQINQHAGAWTCKFYNVAAQKTIENEE
jgi:hypothetical protein